MRRMRWLAIGLILFAVFHVAIDLTALSSVAKIKIKAEAEKDTRLAVYYSTGLSSDSFREGKSVRSQILSGGVRSEITLELKNRICRKLRIDPLQSEGKIKIYSILLSLEIALVLSA